MKGVILAGIIATILASGKSYSASEKEYIKFIEKNGVQIFETFRLPKGEDLSYWGTDKDTYFYKTLDSDLETKAPYWTKGYFNSDNKPDYLYILFQKTNNEAHLIGFMSSQNSYEKIMVEKSEKYMAVETKQNLAVHFHLEGHGHTLSWNNSEVSFEVVQ
jgi:hypothetical protein